MSLKIIMRIESYAKMESELEIIKNGWSTHQASACSNSVAYRLCSEQNNILKLGFKKTCRLRAEYKLTWIKCNNRMLITRLRDNKEFKDVVICEYYRKLLGINIYKKGSIYFRELKPHQY